MTTYGHLKEVNVKADERILKGKIDVYKRQLLLRSGTQSLSALELADKVLALKATLGELGRCV